METCIPPQKSKKIISVYLIVLMILLSYQTFSQSIFEKAGGVKTDFRIFSDSSELTILTQGLIERGFFKTDYATTENQSYGMGYGLQVWYLEFVTTENLKWVEQRRQGAILFGRSYFEIVLLDENNAPLMITKLPAKYLRKGTNENGLFTYSFDLQEIPIILLDLTVTIQIN
jgi:hypothetical protein